MKTIHSTNNGLDAEGVRAFLAAYGIASILIGKSEDRSSAFAIGTSHAPIQVQVMEDVFDEAVELLAARPSQEDQQNLQTPENGAK